MAKAKKKKTVRKKKDRGLAELLGLLKTRPDLVHALVFDHKRVKRLLKSKAARRLIKGVDARRAVQRRFKQARRFGRAGLLHVNCGRITTP